jgi:hypothetical protein
MGLYGAFNNHYQKNFVKPLFRDAKFIHDLIQGCYKMYETPIP